MKKLIINIFILTLFWIHLTGQNLIFKVFDQSNSHLIGANVVVTKMPEQIKYLGSTALDGEAVVSVGKKGKYIYSVTYIGYQSVTDSLVLSKNDSTVLIKMMEATNLLGEVKIIGRKPLMRQDGERTIVDPEPLLGSITNTLELLTMTPGLFVDPGDGGIFLGNSIPAVIYINGREQRLSSADIANVLRSLPPDNILRVEIIRNPSSKYDAASSGGVINVVLKKGIKIGRFGSMNLGFNQGVTGNRFGGINIFETGSKSGFYINTNFSSNGQLDDLTASRKSNAPFLLSQVGETKRRSLLGYLGIGYNQEFNGGWNFSYDARLNANRSKSNAEFNNKTLSFSNILLSDMLNNVSDNTPSLSHNHDFGISRKLDTIGSELNIKLTLGQSSSENNQNYTNVFQLPILPAISGMGILMQNRKFLQFQTDYTKEFGNNFRIETGIKANIQGFRSDSDFQLNVNNQLFSDTTRNNAYKFDENIFAAYGQLSKTFKNQIVITSGVRAEHTSMKGAQTIPVDTSFNVKRLDFFPFVFISRKLIKIAGYDLKGYLIYRKTLSRPSYQNLNPAIRVIDLFNYQAGNPSLNPQFTNNYEFNISFDDQQILAFGKSLTTGIISEVLYNDAQNSSLTVNTYDNIGKSDETYFKITGAIPPIYKYFFVFGAQYNYLKYEGIYNDAPVNFTRGSWQLFTFHRYKLTKSTNIMMQAFMLVKGQRNLVALGNLGQLNFTITQQLMNKKMNISLFARDVLRTMETSFLLQQSNISFAGERYGDNQRIGMTLRFNFGIPTKKEKENMLQGTQAVE